MKVVLQISRDLSFHIFETYDDLLSYLAEHFIYGELVITRRKEEDLQAGDFKLGDAVHYIVPKWARYGPYIITEFLDGQVARLGYPGVKAIETKHIMFLEKVE